MTERRRARLDRVATHARSPTTSGSTAARPRRVRPLRGDVALHHGDGRSGRDVVVRLRPTPPGCSSPTTWRGNSASCGAGTHRGPGAARAVARADGRRARPAVPRDGAGAPATSTRWQAPDGEPRSASADVRRHGRATRCRSTSSTWTRVGSGPTSTTVRDHLTASSTHWAAEMRRVQRGPLPALERLITRAARHQTGALPPITLVHGDAKPGQLRVRRRRGQRRLRLGDDDSR